MKLKSAAESYISDPEITLARRSAESYLHHCNRWERLTTNPDIEWLTKEDVTDFYEACRNSGLATTTFQSSWRSIRTILSYAAEKNWITKVPKIRVAKARRRRPIVPAWDLIDMMYGNASKAIWPVLDYCTTEEFWQAWMAVSYWTGLRLGDMKELRSVDYCSSEKTLLKEASKTSKEHIYPVPEWLARHVDMVSGSGDGRLFSVPRWCDNRIRREMARMCSDAELRKPVSPQQVRRLSINTWSSVHADAGKIIHGTGLGILDFYLDPLVLLQSVMDKVPVPKKMRKPRRAALAAS